MILYNTHVEACKIFPEKYDDCTLLQQYFLNFMSAKKISFYRNWDMKTRILCEAMGVKFK